MRSDDAERSLDGSGREKRLLVRVCTVSAGVKYSRVGESRSGSRELTGDCERGPASSAASQDGGQTG